MDRYPGATCSEFGRSAAAQFCQLVALLIRKLQHEDRLNFVSSP